MTPTIDLDTLTLGKGSHDPGGPAMCVMEAAAYMAGEPWSDHPDCVSPVIAAFLRSWNDALPDDQRHQLVRYLAPVADGGVLGTGPATPAAEERRSWMATDWVVRVHTPAWLRLAGLNDQAATLEQLPEIVSTEIAASIKPALDAIRKDAAAAWAAARDAARAAAWDAARAAAGDAARAAAWDAARAAAGDAAGDAAWDAARAAAGDAAWVAAWAAARAAAWDAAAAAAWAAARAAAWDAARAALAPTVATLQESAHDLAVRMAQVDA